MSTILPALGANLSATVSGISSGGYMAVQMHIINSSLFKGAGIVAGGPFYFFGPPYINNCQFDGVGDMFSHIISSDLHPRDMDWASAGELILFDQTEFINPLYVSDTSSIDKLGYVYIPDTCRDESCQVHVAIHGCH